MSCRVSWYGPDYELKSSFVFFSLWRLLLGVEALLWRYSCGGPGSSVTQRARLARLEKQFIKNRTERKELNRLVAIVSCYV